MSPPIIFYYPDNCFYPGLKNIFRSGHGSPSGLDSRPRSDQFQPRSGQFRPRSSQDPSKVRSVPAKARSVRRKVISGPRSGQVRPGEIPDTCPRGGSGGKRSRGLDLRCVCRGGLGGLLGYLWGTFGVQNGGNITENLSKRRSEKENGYFSEIVLCCTRQHDF